MTKKEFGDVDITVTGMGGIINFEIECIVKFFSELGYEIVLDNPLADWKGDGPHSKMTLEERIEEAKHAHVESRKAKKIFLKANHLPWGG